ncbi:hypothetical protein RintRC_2872 [Richelia intracellularis]|nr:hypothetical protein RintRC_2872 [Richelia intracellularis]
MTLCSPREAFSLPLTHPKFFNLELLRNLRAISAFIMALT